MGLCYRWRDFPAQLQQAGLVERVHPIKHGVFAGPGARTEVRTPEAGCTTAPDHMPKGPKVPPRRGPQFTAAWANEAISASANRALVKQVPSMIRRRQPSRVAVSERAARAMRSSEVWLEVASSRSACESSSTAPGGGVMSRLQRLRTTLSTRELPCDVWLIVAAMALAGLGWVIAG